MKRLSRYEVLTRARTFLSDRRNFLRHSLKNDKQQYCALGTIAMVRGMDLTGADRFGSSIYSELDKDPAVKLLSKCSPHDELDELDQEYLSRRPTEYVTETNDELGYEMTMKMFDRAIEKVKPKPKKG